MLAWTAYLVESSCRPIPPNHRQRLPTRLLFFDTEAYRERVEWGERQSFRLACALWLRLDSMGRVVRHDSIMTESKQALWEWVASHAEKGATLYVVAHNLGYDLQLSDGLRLMSRIGWNLTNLYDNEGRILAVWRRDGRRIVALDSVAILRASLDELGRLVGVAKGSMPEDDTASIEEWYAYCARDVMVLATAFLGWLSFLREHDLGSFKPTLAGQSLSACRHRFYPRTIYRSGDDRVVALELEAYRGGRTECFRLGNLSGRMWHKVDVNSMYPYAMKAFKHPTRSVYYVEGPPVRQLAEWAIRYWVIADCQLDTDEPLYGIRMNGKLVFPVGRFRAVICGEEVRYALEHGHIRQVYRCVLYEQGYLFGAYVDYFYGLRQRYRAEGNRAYEFACKLFLNALYGKFGQRGRKQQVIGESPEEAYYADPYVSAETGERGRLLQIGHRVMMEYTDGVARLASPAVAASITAAARVYLWCLVKQAGRESVAYCDTDSLIVDDDGLARLKPYLSDTALGLLKVEGSSSSLEIRGPKDYSFGSEDRIKGLGKVVGQAEGGAYIVERWQRLRSALREGLDGFVKVFAVPYRRAGRYDKGVVEGDVVHPYRLEGG